MCSGLRVNPLENIGASAQAGGVRLVLGLRCSLDSGNVLITQLSAEGHPPASQQPAPAPAVHSVCFPPPHLPPLIRPSLQLCTPPAVAQYQYHGTPRPFHLSWTPDS